MSKTIVKNTLFLYSRMFFNMVVSLFTSRLILQGLGIVDFGVYNLVGGVVVLFSFLNGAMTGATQRFINFEKTSLEPEAVKKVFNISVVNHGLISIAVFLLAETVGLWFLNYKLNIPASRLVAANWVYQMTILTTVIDVMRVPYNAMIVAYERMSYYAFLGIFESFAKLAVALIIFYSTSNDQLILYGILIMVVNLTTNLIYYSYCSVKFPIETALKYYKDYKKMKELFTFSGWILFGQMANVGATQGLSMIINMFFGVVANAALGVANQVNGAVYSFVSNFQIAFNPQLVQTYAANDIEKHKSMVLTTSKFSFFLLAFLSAPILYFVHTVLLFWLGPQLPEYVEALVQIVVLCSLIDAIAGPFWMSALSIGSIKEYNITLTCINFLTLPFAYILLILGYNPVFAFGVKFVMSVVMQCFRFYFVNRYLVFDKLDFRKYFFSISIVMLFLIMLIYLSEYNDIYTFLEFVSGLVLIEAILLLIVTVFGFKRSEREFICRFIHNRILKR